MNQESLANCFCIISHPSKPKFLVIRHASGWSPPTVQVPTDGYIGLRAQMISDAVLRQYGLRTAVMRQTFESLNLVCVELDVIARVSPEQRESVWVGIEEYQRFRSNRQDRSDPLAAWLEQAAGKKVPGLRPPWQRKGWYQKASGWFEGELERHHLQRTGSTQQHQMCWHDSALLRAGTSGGVYFLKASHPEAPFEGGIAQALARRWPGRFTRPLALSKKHNWMIFADPGPSLYHAPTRDEIVEAAREMGRLQFESASDVGTWTELGAQKSPPGAVANFLEELEGMQESLQSGMTALDDGEWKAMLAVRSGLITDCERLAASLVPVGLVHPEFLPSRVFREDGAILFNSWSELILGHPFLSGARFTDAVRRRSLALAAGSRDAMDPAWVEAAAEAYLGSWGSVAGQEDLAETLALCGRLLYAWDLYRWNAELALVETGSVNQDVRLRYMQRACRDLLRDRGANA